MSLDYDYALSLIRFIIGSVIFLFASLSYHETREIKNRYWLYMILSGLILFELKLTMLSNSPNYPLAVFVLMVVSVCPVLYFLIMPYFEERYLGINADKIQNKEKKYAIFLLSIILVVPIVYQLFKVNFSYEYIQIVSIIGLIGFFWISFCAGSLGGGIAKGFMALSVFLPEWQSLFSIEIPSVIWIFLFFLALAAVKGLFNVAVNIYRRDIKFPQMFFGLRMDLEDIKRNREIVLQEKIKGGEVVLDLANHIDDESYREEQLELFEKEGINRVWTASTYSGVALLLGAYCAYYSLFYSIRILGIPW